MVTTQVAVGTQVKFRDEFSSDLIGIEWETTSETRWAAAGYEFVGIRTRVGKRRSWSYRSAAVADLRDLNGDLLSATGQTRQFGN